MTCASIGAQSPCHRLVRRWISLLLVPRCSANFQKVSMRRVLLPRPSVETRREDLLKLFEHAAKHSFRSSQRFA